MAATMVISTSFSYHSKISLPIQTDQFYTCAFSDSGRLVIRWSAVLQQKKQQQKTCNSCIIMMKFSSQSVDGWHQLFATLLAHKS